MRRGLIGLCALAWVPTVTAAPSVIQIPDGDTGAFKIAVCRSNGAPGHDFELLLAVDGRYDFHGFGPRPIAESDKFAAAIFGACYPHDPDRFSTPADIKGRLRIRGRGAELRGLGLRVAPGAELALEGLDFNLASREGLRALHNLGTTSLERVSIANGRATVVLQPHGPEPALLDGIAINNEGLLRLTNVGLYRLWSHYRLPEGFDIPPPACVPGAAAVYNSGELEMVHVTSAGHQVFDALAECLAEDIFNAPGGRVRLRNSALLSETIVAIGCIGPVQSLGYNYFGRADCVEDLAATDLLGPAPFFDQIPRTSGYRRTLVLPPEHPAAKAIPGAHCATLDQRGFPRLIGATRCDAGALEGGAPPAASPGTVTGLWFQPGADGHYLQLSFVRPDEILLTWQAFDASGANLWIYGLGEAFGHRLTMRLYRNSGPVAAAGGIRGDATAAEIGQATFTLMSCSEAVFEFESLIDGLAAGRLDFRRLAFTEGIACDDGMGQDL